MKDKVNLGEAKECLVQFIFVQTISYLFHFVNFQFFFIENIAEPPPPPLSVHVEVKGATSLLVHYFPPIRLQEKRNIITKYKSIYIKIVQF